MQINGRDVNFLYTVGAYCDYSDWLVSLGTKGASAARGIIRLAVAMNKAYNEVNDVQGDPVTVRELESLPAYVFEELREEVEKAEQEGKKRSVEEEETAGKNAAAAKK